MKDCDKTIRETEPKWPMARPAAVKVMSIQGRLNRERERLADCGMSEEERASRAQWIRDQRLSPNEPKKVPQMYKELYNPIRRFYRFPLDKLEKLLAPKLGEDYAVLCRHIIGKSGMIIAGIYAAAYYFKYNTNDWTRKGGWRLVPSRRSVVPGDPGWPYQPEKVAGADYADRGFKDSPIQKLLKTAAQDLANSGAETGAVASPEIGVTSGLEYSLKKANLSDETFERSEKVDV